MESPDAKIRVQAIRASETLYKAGDKSFASDYRAMTKDADPDVVIQAMLTLNVLKAKNHLKVTRVNFMGMSLGALEGAYLSLLDGAEGRIGISRYLLVNPPLVNGVAFTRQGRCQERQETLGTTKPPYTLAVLAANP